MQPHTSPSSSPGSNRTMTIRNHRRRHGLLGTITVVMLLTLMGLAAISGAGGIRPRDASAHAGGGVITLANYGAATVDGVFTDGEYGEGCFLPPSQSVGKGASDGGLPVPQLELQLQWDLSLRSGRLAPVAMTALAAGMDSPITRNEKVPAWATQLRAERIETESN